MCIRQILTSHSKHRLGIEGVVTFKKPVVFDAENYKVTIPRPDGNGEVTVSVFDKVVVHVEVEKDRNTQRGRVKMSLAEPIDSRGY
jgi:exosome complex exonuclease DIS3/RRP44